MLDRATDRLHKIVSIARAEVRRMKHDTVEPEHLLFALLKEGSGMGVAVIEISDVDPQTLTDQLTSRMQPGSTTGPYGGVPFSASAKQVFDFGIQEARSIHHNYLGSEHLLLGLLRLDQGDAAEILRNAGLQLDTTRENLLKLLDGKL